MGGIVPRWLIDFLGLADNETHIGHTGKNQGIPWIFSGGIYPAIMGEIRDYPAVP